MLAYLLVESLGLVYYVGKYTLGNLTMAVYKTMFPTPEPTSLEDIKLHIIRVEDRLKKYEEVLTGKQMLLA